MWEGAHRHKRGVGRSWSGGKCVQSWESHPGSPCPAREGLSPFSTGTPAMGKRPRLKQHDPHIPSLRHKSRHVTLPSQHPLPEWCKKGIKFSNAAGEAQARAPQSQHYTEPKAEKEFVTTVLFALLEQRDIWSQDIGSGSM